MEASAAMTGTLKFPYAFFQIVYAQQPGSPHRQQGIPVCFLSRLLPFRGHVRSMGGIGVGDGFRAP